MSPRYLNTIPEISTSSDDITYNDEISSINDSSNEIRSSLSKDDRSIEIGDETNKDKKKKKPSQKLESVEF